MAKAVKITKEHDAGLYDSDTEKSCVTEKVVDITEDCPSGERTVLLFTRVKRGRIVQITTPYEGETYMGAHIHFFVDELDREFNLDEKDDTFVLAAARAGMGRLALRRLIEQHAPQ